MEKDELKIINKLFNRNDIYKDKESAKLMKNNFFIFSC